MSSHEKGSQRAQRAHDLKRHHKGLNGITTVSISTLSDEIAVLHQGRIIAKAKPDEIRRNPEVMRAYWGG